ncbi:MAG TPA: hypothetical protein VFC73_03685 [Syntrophomonadaceae bacterium]|nr:hypothetical protein [Syntrophomonadaceae bacterium]
MRKEYYIFLILIVAAAVIAGSTISLAGNIDIISPNLNQSQVTSSAKETLPNEKKTEETLLSSINTHNNEVIVISAEEQNQIIEMLQALGMVNKQDSNEFIKHFQTQNSLTPTGALDSITLDIIIEKVKLEKANRSLQTPR